MLLITGPNMGGKSTYMRQNALIALLAHIGSYVPATAAQHSALIDRIFTRIGSSDDLASGRSTFMVEMTETANILHNATPRSLVLMDEIGRGTSTFDGLGPGVGLRRASRPKLRAFTLFATHYFELTRLPRIIPAWPMYTWMRWSTGDAIVFLHTVQDGPANRSYGLQVAALAGIPATVVQQAKQRLRELEKHKGREKSPVPPVPPATDPQLPLFTPEPHPAVKILVETEPDTLSPRQALDVLYRLKALTR